MRSQLFRAGPVSVVSADQVVLLKDMDGADPFDLFIENVDVAASLRTRYASKNANILFTAKTGGAAGNSASVTISDVTGSAGDAFDIDVSGADVTITLARDASGWPTMTADQIIDALNGDTDFAAVMVASRAPGSDGSALVGAPGDIDPSQLPSDFSENLSGGVDSAILGDVDLFISPTGAPAFAGPWEELTDTTFDSLAADTVKHVAFVDKPIRGLKVTASAGAYASSIVLTGVARKR